jgi:hypothetical protein
MFRTELIPKPSPEKIQLDDKIFLIGSCFADHIGNLLSAYKFKTLLNPFGVIYNPHSIFRLLIDSTNNRGLDENGLFEYEGIYRHFDFHSDISAGSKDEFYRRYERASADTREFTRTAEWLIISMGTSIVFEHKNYRKIVSNCHKLPGGEFNQRFLSPEEILSEFESFYHSVSGMNKRLKIILTVSPVRHIRSTLEKNSQSKAILRYVAGQLAEKWDNVKYFPSYELMMDDLRDYRFYMPDMLHPNEVAIDYIWKKFTDAYFDPDATSFVNKWTQIRKALGHKPFNPKSTAHQRFIRNTIEKLKSFERMIDVREELTKLENQLL